MTTLSPFQERASFKECVNSMALTEQGDLVRVVDWAATKYWGERVFEVRDKTGCRYDRLESELTPAGPAHPLMADYLAAEARGFRLQSLASSLQARQASAELSALSIHRG